MDLFVSYRRDDTGGRAGRLADSLSARFGRRHVFQDVTTVAPGASFDEQVDRAIAVSDVVLVVIGPGWADDRDETGRRRLDRSDDFVRHEVRAALVGDVVVVPVLVGGARLPSEDSLPDDLRPLVRRQAVTLRDESWHRDVEALIRQLTDGPDLVADRRSRMSLVAVLAAVVAVLAIAAVWVLVARRDDSSSDSEEPPPCPPTDESWTTVPVEGEPTVVEGSDANLRLSVTPESVAWTPDGDQFAIQVTASVTNVSDPVPSTDDETYVSGDDVSYLAVRGVQTDDLRCVTYDGARQLTPDRTVVVTLGFVTTQDPADAPIMLDMQEDAVVITG